MVEKVALVVGLTDKILCEGSISSLRPLAVTTYGTEMTLSCKMKDQKRKPCGKVEVTMMMVEDPSLVGKKKTMGSLPDDFKGMARLLSCSPAFLLCVTTLALMTIIPPPTQPPSPPLY